MNKYFLLIALLQLWPYITPVNPVTTWVPLAVIFAISTAKEGVEDYRRWRQDRLANERPVRLVTSVGVVECASEDVQCGDVVKVMEGEEFCADMVLLASSERSGGCWIETSNVDGETNLKGRVALPETQRLVDVGSGGGGMQEEDGLGRLKCTVECAVPNKNIYGFDSTITLSNDTTLALSTEQLLLQATTLCNTQHIYGLVVYTGNETKVGQNKNTPRHKYTTLDTHIDTTIIVLFVLQCVVIVVWGITGSVLLYVDEDRPVWYLRLSTLAWYDPAVIPLRFLLLASMMIPISLKVTLDLIKLMYSLWIRWDLGMWDERRGVGAEARNTALAEELGCVQYVMTDKTGTLTENVMMMREMATHTRQYRGGDGDDTTSSDELSGDLSTDARLQADVRDEEKEAHQLLRCLMLCNTVVPSHKQPVNHSSQSQHNRSTTPNPPSPRAQSSSSSSPATTPPIHYSSSSPDELCLVQFAASIGYTLESRDNQIITARPGPAARTASQWTVLATCDFTSTRKRMSVVLRDSTTGRMQLVMKGADDVVFARVRRGDREEAKRVEAYKAVLDGYGRKGLRTLVFAQRDVSEAEWKEWSVRYHRAALDVGQREQALADVYEHIERDVSLVGVTGIEDKLQAGVEETLVMLRAAGVKVWMLTGDKQQTAEEIGRSSGLIARRDRIHYVNAVNRLELDTVLQNIARDIQSSSSSPASSAVPTRSPYVLIIDGATLSLCLFYHADLFYLLSSSASAVVCCRCTPSQKSAVAALMVTHRHVTLGVGDGGNDVSLIQTANVGIGISGREGTQAARASDFSISQFSHLQRLMLVHGRWSYMRTAWIAQYCLYKSLIIALVQLTFAFVSRFSGASFFDSVSIMSYNLFYTSVLGVFYLFEQDLSAATLLAHPRLYATTRERHNYTITTLLCWLARSVYQAAFVSIVTFCVWLGSTSVGGLGDTNQLGLALIAYSSIVLVQCFTLYVEMTFIVLWVHVIVVVTVVAFLIINVSISASVGTESYSVYGGLLSDPVYWFTVLLSVVGCLLPVIGVKYWWRTEWPSQVDLALEEELADAAGKRGSDRVSLQPTWQPSHSLCCFSSFTHYLFLSCFLFCFCAQAHYQRRWLAQWRHLPILRCW